MNIKIKSILATIATILILTAAPFAQNQPQETGLILKKDTAFAGYTLFAPLGATVTFLIDMEGRIVNVWESDYQPGQSVYLLDNGHLLRTASVGPSSNRTFHGGGAGGRVQEFTWEGELVWDFEFNSDRYLLHHDIEKLPSGNVLMIAWEKKEPQEALAAGRNPGSLGQEGLWPDFIIEVKPTGKTTGKIVWEWHVWDHLVQDYDSSKNNYSDVAKHPELINFNPGDWTKRLSNKQLEKLEALGYLRASRSQNPGESHPGWTHINAVDYNAPFDQILLSVLGFNEIWIIDHSTTTKEASGHTGGRSGKGGDILYRWGNPQLYGAGTPEDQTLYAQHDAQWIPEGIQGGGHILVFNNGMGRSDGDYSSVDEVVSSKDKEGNYIHKKGQTYGLGETVWSYSASPTTNFYSSHISGCQRLPNGNTLICSGENGILFEVTRKGDIVW